MPGQCGRYDFYTQHPREIVVVGRPDDTATADLVRRIRSVYLPNRTLSIVDPAQADQLPALLQGKGQVNGKPTVYVCHRRTCSAPVTSWTEASALLQ